jgi:hypothetical protein
MKSILKIFIFSWLFFFSKQIAIAQDQVRNISITVTGGGKTLHDAKLSALQSAIEQSFGAFISTKTEILDDKVIADQITSVSSGTIVGYKVIDEIQKPNEGWLVTLNAIVSFDKLESFAQSKGVNIEFKGNIFAFNIKQQLLNETAEIASIVNMFKVLHENMQNAFDFSIQNLQPQSQDSKSEKWLIPIEITSTANKNIIFCEKYFTNTLSALSLSEKEVETYKSLNKEIFQINVVFKDNIKTFYLRSKQSIQIVESFKSNFRFYLNNFSVLPTVKASNIKTEYFEGLLENPTTEATKNNRLRISFLNEGKKFAKFSFNDIKTLDEINHLTGYSVKTNGVNSNFEQGGILVNYPVPEKWILGIAIGLDGIVQPSMYSRSDIIPGDKVLRINNLPYTSIEDLRNAIKNGESVVIEFERNGKRKKVQIQPGKTHGVKGLVLAPVILGYGPWEDAKEVCDKLTISQHSDWELPNKEDVLRLANMYDVKLGGIPNSFIWADGDNLGNVYSFGDKLWFSMRKSTPMSRYGDFARIVCIRRF